MELRFLATLNKNYNLAIKLIMTKLTLTFNVIIKGLMEVLGIWQQVNFGCAYDGRKIGIKLVRSRIWGYPRSSHRRH
jgi:hypothetical protein